MSFSGVPNVCAGIDVAPAPPLIKGLQIVVTYARYHVKSDLTLCRILRKEAGRISGHCWWATTLTMGGTLCGARRYRDHRARAETLVGRTEAAAHEDNAASRAAATRQSGQLAAQAFECPLVRPEVVVEVTYLTRTDDNLLRQFAIRGSARTSLRGRRYGRSHIRISTLGQRTLRRLLEYIWSPN